MSYYNRKKNKDNYENDIRNLNNKIDIVYTSLENIIQDRNDLLQLFNFRINDNVPNENIFGALTVKIAENINKINDLLEVDKNIEKNVSDNSNKIVSMNESITNYFNRISINEKSIKFKTDTINLNIDEIKSNLTNVKNDLSNFKGK